MKVIITLLFLLIISDKSHSQSFYKISPPGGPVLEVLSSPANFSIEYAIVKDHGLYRRDLDKSPVWEQFVTEKVFDIETDKQNNFYYGSSKGLFRIDSSGQSPVQLFNGTVYQVVCGTGNIILIDTCSASRNTYYPDYQSALYLISTDGGFSWEKLSHMKYSRTYFSEVITDYTKRASFFFSEYGMVLMTYCDTIYRSHITYLFDWEKFEPFNNRAYPRLKFIKQGKNNNIYAYSQYVDHHPGGYIEGGLYRSSNTGQTWEAITDINDVTFATFIGDKIFCGNTDGSLFEINETQKSKKLLQKFGGPITSIVPHGDSLIVSTLGNIYVTDIKGLGKHTSDSGILYPFVSGIEVIDYNYSKRLVAAINNSGIWTSDDFGKNWIQRSIDVRIFPGNLKKSIDGSTLYAAGNSVFAGKNNAEDWNLCPGLQVAYYGWYGNTMALCPSPFNPNKIYVLFDDHSLDDHRGRFLIDVNYFPHNNEWQSMLPDPDFKKFGHINSMNICDNFLWTTGSNNLQKISIQQDSLEMVETLNLPGNTNAEKFALKNNIVIFLQGKDVWISTDNGISWTNRTPTTLKYYLYPTPDNEILSGEFLINEDNSIYFVSPGNGIFFTNDSAATWTNITSVSETQGIFQMQFINDENNALVFASDQGLFTDNVIVNVDDAEKALRNIPAYSLHQNYPNPFNPSTAIRYQIPSVDALSPVEVLVTLKVYDILGRQVAQLVNEVQGQGEYSVEFNGAELSSGMYIVNMRAGEFNKSMKILLLK